jgi:hypothetical protein
MRLITFPWCFRFDAMEKYKNRPSGGARSFLGPTNETEEEILPALVGARGRG